jgi:acetyltransferase
MTMLEKQSYVFKETLENGTAVTLRAARTDDGPRIRRALANLHSETIYRRFFGYKSDFNDAEVERITGMDFEHDVALLVTIDSGDDEIIIGGASYSAGDPAPRTAEIAFTVEEDYQGSGLLPSSCVTSFKSPGRKALPGWKPMCSPKMGPC